MKISRRDGRVRFAFDEHEAALLLAVFASTAEVFELADADDPVVRRLFPAAYPDDDAADQEYRSITEATLRSARSERLDACRDELDAGSEIDLGDDDVATRWIQVLNDVRLTVGTRIGVTEDQPDIDPADPESGMWVVYYWLTELQETLVTALMG